MNRSCFLTSRSVQQKSSPEGSREKTLQEVKQNYEPGGGVVSAAAGDSAGDSAVAGADSIGAGVVVVSTFVGGVVAAGVAAGSVVSVFCSHAARSAAPASMQMYFFIFEIHIGLIEQSHQA